MRKTPIMINDKHRPVTRLMSERLNPKTKYGCKKKKKISNNKTKQKTINS